jgi:hypothetical protein
MKIKQPTPQLLPIFFVLIVLVVYVYPRIAGSENYFPLFPGIDTIYLPQFSEDKFKLISIGMSRKEVLELLGEPSYKNTYPPFDFLPKGYSYTETNLTWGYGTDGRCRGWCDLAWVGYFIEFDSKSSNAKVVDTRREVFLD